MPPIAEQETEDRLAPASLDLRVQTSSYDPENRTVEVVMSTGAAVRRWSWRYGYFDEKLSLDPSHVRLERLNSGRAHVCEVHNTYSLDRVLGTVIAGSVRFQGEEMVGRVQFHQTERALEVAGRVQRSELTNFSLGYVTHAQEHVERDGEVDERTAIDWEPYEVSIVPIPADFGAHSRSAPFGEITNTCVLRRSSGNTEEAMPPETKTDENQTRNAPAPTPDAPPQPSESPEERTKREADIRQQAAAEERKRGAEIRSECERVGLERSFAEELVEKGQPLAEVRSLIIDKVAEVRSGPEINSRVSMGAEDHGKRSKAAENTLLHRIDPDAYPLTDGGRDVRGLSLIELGEFTQATRGYEQGRGLTRVQRAQGLMNGGSRGMHGSSDFKFLLANALKKVLLRSYEEAGQTFQPLVRQRPTDDFKPISVTRIGEAPDLEQIEEGAEYTYGTINDTGDTYRVLKYGKGLIIGWETLINDDLDALGRIPRMFGVRAAMLESNLFWDLVNSNPVMSDGIPLFHVDHMNVGVGPIGLQGLTDGMVSMGLQTGLDGKTPLNISPRYLVTPIARAVAAQQEVVLTTAPTETPKTNPFRGKLDPISESRLDKADNAAWYLFARHQETDTFERAYLEGHQQPFFDREEGFDVDGSKIKVRHVVAFKAIDWRGAYKSTGN